MRCDVALLRFGTGQAQPPADALTDGPLSTELVEGRLPVAIASVDRAVLLELSEIAHLEG